jgi:hypothetical protein
MAAHMLCLWLFASLSPEAGELLGFDTEKDLAFVELYRREEPPEKEPGWTVAALDMANAGGNRLIFRVTFSAAYPADNGLLILYVDSDNDPET